ncbi:hypothetical protein PAMP_000187 [Pampus punctatissimus]
MKEGAFCEEGCRSGGTCVSPNTCVCPSGFTGRRCETVLHSISVSAALPYKTYLCSTAVYTVSQWEVKSI